MTSPAVPPSLRLRDEVLKVETSFSLGYCKPFPDFKFGSSDKAFGMPGTGGSLGYADPDVQVGFAYAPNKWKFYLFNDPRQMALRDALYACLKEMGETL